MFRDSKAKVYDFVRHRILSGSPPSVREVQRALGFKAAQSAQEHLDALVSEGALEKIPRVSRGYRLPGKADSTFFVPLLGRVQAGAFTEAVEDLEGYVGVEGRDRGADLFALRVRGESMRDAAILHDDIVIVRRQTSAQNRDIVVALVDEEATVKRFRMVTHGTRTRVELHAENPDFSPIIPDGEVRILGKVIEIRRYLETQVYRPQDES